MTIGFQVFWENMLNSSCLKFLIPKNFIVFSPYWVLTNDSWNSSLVQIKTWHSWTGGRFHRSFRKKLYNCLDQRSITCFLYSIICFDWLHIRSQSYDFKVFRLSISSIFFSIRLFKKSEILSGFQTVLGSSLKPWG